MRLETDDGATGPDNTTSTTRTCTRRPTASRRGCRCTSGGEPSYRTLNGGDDASILYHEYTHGLSNRLIIDADGAGALNSPQAGAMGEGWSDWYAKDFLVAQFPGLDNPRSTATSTWAPTRTRRRTRSAPTRLPVAAAARARSAVDRAAGLHLRRLRQDRRRAGGARRRRDLGADAVGPAHGDRLVDGRAASDHAGDAALAAGAVLPGRAQRDPAGRRGAGGTRSATRSGRCSPARHGLLRVHDRRATTSRRSRTSRRRPRSGRRADDRRPRHRRHAGAPLAARRWRSARSSPTPARRPLLADRRPGARLREPVLTAPGLRPRCSR